LSGAARAWIDGAARGNPGDAGFGVRVERGERTDEVLGFLGRTTNNVAEYAGLVAALTFCRREGIDDLVVHSDSQLLVRQIEGAYKVKAAHLVPIFLKVLALRRGIARFEIHHVPREQNLEADRLANRAVDLRVPPPEWLEFTVS
jgi:ribonuclease HI